MLDPENPVISDEFLWGQHTNVPETKFTHCEMAVADSSLCSINPFHRPKLDANDIAGLRFGVEMKFGCAVVELPHHALNSPVYWGMISTITSDKLDDDRLECVGRQLGMGDLHLLGQYLLRVYA